MPEWPSGIANMAFSRLRFHALHGCYVQQMDGIMHRGTHMDAPVHVTANLPYINEYEPWRFFGTGVAVSVPKGKWGVITAEDLENARPRIEPGDIVMINTGSHHNWGDNDDYFGYSPGLYRSGAEWLVERGVKLVGVDVQALDHPLGTKIAAHGTGPSHPQLLEEYSARRAATPWRISQTGRSRTRRCCRRASPVWRTWAATWTRSPASAAPSWSSRGTIPRARRACCASSR